MTAFLFKSNFMKKYNLEIAQQIFRNSGCQLLAKEYKNNIKSMSYICGCGNHSMITLAHFQQGQRCKDCAGISSPTLEDVKLIYKQKGCVLLATKYINNRITMPYVCKCGKESSASLKNFKKSTGCCNCRGVSQKLSYKDVFDFFEKQGCVLLAAEYINSRTKMLYICSCGRQSMIDWNKFQSGRRCKKCAKEKLSLIFRCPIEKIQTAFQSVGLTLLSDNYLNARQQLLYRCDKCGDVNKMMYMSVLQGCGCRQCGINRTADNCRLTLNDIIARLGTTNMKLIFDDRLSKKITTNQYFWYRCNDCGHEGKISGHNTGRRGCANCKYINRVSWKECEDFAAGINKLERYFEN